MRCPKCAGLVVPVPVPDLFEKGILLDHCLNCGTYDDPVMQANRRLTGSEFPVFRGRK